jgi:uncharacterized protein YndB with AHSA1/START domain
MGIIAIGAVAAVAYIAYAASRKPDAFRIERSAVLKASPEAIFKHINDFHLWTAWSPWEKLDPDLKRTYSGAEQGVGAIYEWSGNGKAGQGKMTILESTPYQRIVLELQFIKPFPATNRTEFTLTPKEGGTEVSWAMSGTHTFVNKLFTIFMDLDKFVAPQFEEGLANLGKVAATEGEKRLSTEA